MKSLIITLLAIGLKVSLLAQNNMEIISDGATTNVGLYALQQGTAFGTNEETGIFGHSIGDGDGWNFGLYGRADGNGGAQFGVYGISWSNGVYGTSFGSGNGVFGQIFGQSDGSWRVAVFGDIAQGTTGAQGATIKAGYFNGDVDVIGTFSNPSDRKLKKNIKPYHHALEQINRLNVATYEYDRDKYKSAFPKGQQVGLIAQELKKVYPHLVNESAFPKTLEESQEEYEKNYTSKKFLTVNYLGLVPILIQGMQEQQNLIAHQQEEIQRLKSQVAAINKALKIE